MKVGDMISIAVGVGALYLVYQIYKKFTEGAGSIDDALDRWAKNKVARESPAIVPAGNFVLPGGTLVPVSSTHPTVVNGVGYVVIGSKTYKIGPRDSNDNWPVTLTSGIPVSSAIKVPYQ